MTRFVVTRGLVSLIPLLLYCPAGGKASGKQGLSAPREQPLPACVLLPQIIRQISQVSCLFCYLCPLSATVCHPDTCVANASTITTV